MQWNFARLNSVGLIRAGPGLRLRTLPLRDPIKKSHRANQREAQKNQ